MQITIDEYAARYKMSKEMIRAKLRAGRLPHTVAEGTTYIVVEDAAQSETPSKQTSAARHQSTAGAIIMMYQKENRQLKRKIAELEAKVDGLISDKEQMLREERDRIETVYANRDEQLKAFLELVNAKLVQEGFKLGTAQNIESVPAHNEAVSVTPASAVPETGRSGPIELLAYLKTKHYTDAEVKRVKKRFAKAYGSDIRVNQQNGQFILDFSKYDYSDLLTR